MADERRIAVLIPALDEEKTIRSVIADFRRDAPKAMICVFDNGSADMTAQLACQSGAQVFGVRKRGKGNVIRYALQKIEADIYVMVDADDTYHAGDVHGLIRPVLEGKADMVIGNRFGFGSGGFSYLHIIGNRIINLCMRFCFPCRISDILSGYRIFTGEVAGSLDLRSRGFTIETEMTIKALEKGFRISEIPIRYRKRTGQSTSKLNSFHDARRIISAIVRLFWSFRKIEFCSVAALMIFALISGFL
ncbi:glycosyltransferase [Candidatus Woesearchaeota archaeon]|nr:glycosyltransferase [Candidatus Woesearchaeota archaeon]